MPGFFGGTTPKVAGASTSSSFPVCERVLRKCFVLRTMGCSLFPLGLLAPPLRFAEKWGLPASPSFQDPTAESWVAGGSGGCLINYVDEAMGAKGLEVPFDRLSAPFGERELPAKEGFRPLEVLRRSRCVPSTA